MEKKRNQNVQKCLFGLAVLLTAVVMCGCSTLAESPRLEAIQKEDRSDVDQFARKAGEAMLEAYQKQDYKKFSAFFAPELAERLEENDFRLLRTELGEWREKAFLTGLHNPSFASYLWKVTFVQFSDGKYLTFETIFQMSVVKRSGEYQVVGCWFR